ncbi:MAG: hypothetical protein R3E89_04300 [Thiolinea sp.]
MTDQTPDAAAIRNHARQHPSVAASSPASCAAGEQCNGLRSGRAAGHVFAVCSLPRQQHAHQRARVALYPGRVLDYLTAEDVGVLAAFFSGLLLWLLPLHLDFRLGLIMVAIAAVSARRGRQSALAEKLLELVNYAVIPKFRRSTPITSTGKSCRRFPMLLKIICAITATRVWKHRSVPMMAACT